MMKFATSLRTRVTAALMLAVLATPMAVAAADCYKTCNSFSLDVYEMTKDRAFADAAYDKCVAEQCPK